MNKQIMIFIPIGIAVLITGAILYMQTADTPADSLDYSMAADIDAMLLERGIEMSTPIRLSERSQVEEFCTFFDDARQDLIEYCASTELLDQNEDFLGNIHMVGTAQSPGLVIAILEVASTDTANVVAVFETVVQVTVCACWEQESPGGFGTVASWIGGIEEFHEDAEPGITTKSSIITLEDKRIQMETTDTQEGRLWKLFVAT